MDNYLGRLRGNSHQIIQTVRPSLRFISWMPKGKAVINQVLRSHVGRSSPSLGSFQRAGMT
jgi:hypothetical protein